MTDEKDQPGKVVSASEFVKQRLYKELRVLIDESGQKIPTEHYPMGTWENLTGAISVQVDQQDGLVGQTLRAIDPIKLITLMAHRLAASELNDTITTEPWVTYAPDKPFEGGTELDEDGIPVLDPE